MGAEIHHEILAWIESLPPAVREVALRYPPGCYRSVPTPSHLLSGHYMLRSYDEEKSGAVTLKVVHGDDSFLPGVTVFGFDPADLIPCGCGDWSLTDKGIAIGEGIIEAEQRRRGMTN